MITIQSESSDSYPNRSVPADVLFREEPDEEEEEDEEDDYKDDNEEDDDDDEESGDGYSE
jgi:hypothetical protein